MSDNETLAAAWLAGYEAAKADFAKATRGLNWVTEVEAANPFEAASS